MALTRTMARDLGGHRIRVNTVVPGWVMTERQKELWVTPEALEKQLARQCLPDPIDPVYLARMVLFLRRMTLQCVVLITLWSKQDRFDFGIVLHFDQCALDHCPTSVF